MLNIKWIVNIIFIRKWLGMKFSKHKIKEKGTFKREQMVRNFTRKSLEIGRRNGKEPWNIKIKQELFEKWMILAWET